MQPGPENDVLVLRPGQPAKTPRPEMAGQLALVTGVHHPSQNVLAFERNRAHLYINNRLIDKMT